MVRYYLQISHVAPTLPFPAGDVQLYASASTQPIAGYASVHAQYRYFLQIAGLDAGDGMVALSAAAHALSLWSDAAIEAGPKVYQDRTGTGMFDRHVTHFGAPWGHYADHLEATALEAMTQYGPKIFALIRGPVFNPLANALRLYTSGLTLLPSDVALVSLVTALEGLFTTSGENISYRFRLAIASFLESDKEKRQEVLALAKRAYDTRSKVVHGASLQRDQEAAAILLADTLTPEAEHLARTCIKRIFEEHLDTFFQTAKNETRDQFFTLMSLGYTQEEALRAVNVRR